MSRVPPAGGERIAVISHSLVGGGAERIAVNLANQWAGEGEEVYLLCLRSGADYLAQVLPAVHLVRLNARRLRYAAPALGRSLAAIGPTAVLSVSRESSLPLMAAWHLPGRWQGGVRRLVLREANTLHGLDAAGPWRGRLQRWLMRRAYRAADRVIANSADTAADLARAGIRADAVVLANPVLPADYRALGDGPCEHPWLDDPGLRVILAAGRLHAQKDFALLLDAFARVSAVESDTCLVILGKGEEQPALEARARELNVADKVDFAGFVDNPLPYYRKADVFALSSRWEGFGNVIVESLAMGTPVVATDCPGGPGFILEQGLYGRLVPVGDAAAFVEALLASLAETPEVERLQARAAAFTVARVAGDYREQLA